MPQGGVLNQIEVGKALWRVVHSRRGLTTVFRTDEEHAVWVKFLQDCIDRYGLPQSSLMALHDDDLHALFNDLNVPIPDRATIRFYLMFPDAALQLLWTCAKIGIAVALAVGQAIFRIGSNATLRRVAFAGAIGCGSIAWFSQMQSTRRRRQQDQSTFVNANQ